MAINPNVTGSTVDPLWIDGGPENFPTETAPEAEPVEKTFDIDTPDFWMPLSVISGLMSGFCERAAYISDTVPNFPTGMGTWVKEADSRGRPDNVINAAIVSRAAANVAIHGDTGTLFTQTSSAQFLLPGSANGSSNTNYMASFDSALALLISPNGGYVDANGASYTFSGLAQAARTRASTSSAISMPGQYGSGLTDTMKIAYPSEWAKQRKWMLDELKYTGNTTGSVDIIPIVSTMAKNWKESYSSTYATTNYDSAYASAYAAGITSSSVDGEFTDTLGVFAARTYDQTQLFVNSTMSSASVVYGAISSDTEVTAGKKVTVYTDVCMRHESLCFDYNGLEILTGSTVVKAVNKASGYQINSGAKLVLWPGGGVSAVSVESGGTLYLSGALCSSGTSLSYKQAASSYSTANQYSPTSNLTASAIISGQTVYAAPADNGYYNTNAIVSLTPPLAGTIYTPSAGVDQYSLANEWLFKLFYSSETVDNSTIYYYLGANIAGDWTESAGSMDYDDFTSMAAESISSSVLAGAVYVQKVPVILPGAEETTTAYVMPDGWFLTSSGRDTAVVYGSCGDLNIMDGGVVLPVYGQSDGVYTTPTSAFHFTIDSYNTSQHNQNVPAPIGTIRRNYQVNSLALPGALLDGYYNSNMWVCINNATSVVNGTKDGINVNYWVTGSAAVVSLTYDGNAARHVGIYAANGAEVSAGGALYLNMTFDNATGFIQKYTLGSTGTNQIDSCTVKDLLILRGGNAVLQDIYRTGNFDVTYIYPGGSLTVQGSETEAFGYMYYYLKEGASFTVSSGAHLMLYSSGLDRRLYNDSLFYRISSTMAVESAEAVASGSAGIPLTSNNVMSRCLAETLAGLGFVSVYQYNPFQHCVSGDSNLVSSGWTVVSAAFSGEAGAQQSCTIFSAGGSATSMQPFNGVIGGIINYEYCTEENGTATLAYTSGDVCPVLQLHSSFALVNACDLAAMNKKPDGRGVDNHYSSFRCRQFYKDPDDTTT